MTAYFSIQNRRSETIACACILLLSIFYSAITYENVYDITKIEEATENFEEFNDEMFAKWKSEYAHPLVIGSTRKREVSQIRRIDHEVQNASEV